MSVGLLALLDDVAAIAKAAAASLDDVAAQAARASVKAAGVVIDDTAITPRFVAGVSPARELPIVAKIGLGSIRNKLLILLPAALLLSALAPWAVTPLLMLGGAYLCYEGVEKVVEALWPHAPAPDAEAARPVDPTQAELRLVSSAVRTDLILSAEIMAITLASIPEGSVWSRAAILAVVGIGITVGVYGTVALIVKADDVGLALARSGSGLARAVGRGLVRVTPVVLQALSVVGTAAMIWVGGGIILHGLDAFAVAPQATGLIHHAAEAAAARLPAFGGLIDWAVTALASGLLGLAIGGALLPVASRVIAPLAERTRALLPGGRSAA